MPFVGDNGWRCHHARAGERAQQIGAAACSRSVVHMRIPILQLALFALQALCWLLCCTCAWLDPRSLLASARDRLNASTRALRLLWRTNQAERRFERLLKVCHLVQFGRASPFCVLFAFVRVRARFFCELMSFGC